MRQFGSLKELKEASAKAEHLWLLLYKNGSEQSDCAYRNYSAAIAKAGENDGKVLFCSADLQVVHDIHPAFGVTSVPALLHLEHGELRNLIKGCHQPEQFSVIFDRSVVVLSTRNSGKAQARVTVYTTPVCSWCNTIKRHFQVNGIQYREIDVSKDQKAAEEMVRRSGQQGVPQTDINGEVIVGFDKARIDKLLGLN